EQLCIDHQGAATGPSQQLQGCVQPVVVDVSEYLLDDQGDPGRTGFQVRSENSTGIGLQGAVRGDRTVVEVEVQGAQRLSKVGGFRGGLVQTQREQGGSGPTAEQPGGTTGPVRQASGSGFGSFRCGQWS